MFGGFNDPFFGNADRHFANMHQMMMADFMDPFGASSRHRQTHQNAIQQAGAAHNGQQLMRHQDPFAAMMSNPFALMNQMTQGIFGNGNMDHMMQNASQNPNAHVYSSSTVMSYSNNGGAPKVYQATSETKQLPGGIKETRNAVRDSEKGVERVAIGHHIGDKAHIIERQRKRDGEVEEIVNYENIDENEVNDFNREFEQRIHQHPHSSGATSSGHSRSAIRGSRGHHHHHHSHHNAGYGQPLAIDHVEHNSQQQQQQPQQKRYYSAGWPPRYSRYF